MITPKTIENYVDHQPVLVKQTFSVILDNKSKSALDTLSAYLIGAKSFFNRAGIVTVSKDNWIKGIASEYDIDSFMDILRGESLKETKTIGWKILKTTIGNFADRLIGNNLGIDFVGLPHEQRMNVGDAIYLAALHNELSKTVTKSNV